MTSCTDTLHTSAVFPNRHRRQCREFGRDIYIGFIDFSQAHDSVWREGMWELLGKYGVDPYLIRILKNLYEGIMACVRIEGENTEAFDVKTGLRQGCILSPTLFNITLDYIMKRAMEGREGIQVGERSLKDTEYADDAALLAETNKFYNVERQQIRYMF